MGVFLILVHYTHSPKLGMNEHSDRLIDGHMYRKSCNIIRKVNDLVLVVGDLENLYYDEPAKRREPDHVFVR